MGWFRRETTIQVTCQYCGKSEPISYVQKSDAGRSYWHISRPPKWFSNDKASLGGADIRCGCIGDTMYMPNATKDPPRTGIDFSARQHDRWLPRESSWENVAYDFLTKNGMKPDSAVACYFQHFSDSRPEYEGRVDAAIGVYHDAQFLRFVARDAGVFERDMPTAEVHKIILRTRTTPLMGRIPGKRLEDNRWLMYDSWLQTRVYRVGPSSSVQSGEPRYDWHLERIIIDDENGTVFDWLCRVTGADFATDTQDKPLEGYPDGG